jgi:hypothetical protein
MTIGAPHLVAFAALAVVFVLILFGLWQGRGARFHERGHLILSGLPWLHLLASYLFAFYVRIGFGSWPRSCIDNPDLPLIDLSVPLALTVFVVVFALPPVWLGWLVVRCLKGAGRWWPASVIVFASGMAALLAALTLDPWGFWSWVWD